MTRVPRLLVAVSLVLLPMAALPAVATAATAPKWIQRIEDVIGERGVSVAIGNDGDLWYKRLAWVGRPPASNEKLLLSMSLLDRFAPSRTIRLEAMAAQAPTGAGVIRGDLWLVGHGDPETNGRDLTALTTRLVAEGVTKIRGGVIGSTGPFRRDWFAPGWKDYFPRDYVALPTALTYRRNVDATGRHISDPELRAAKTLTSKLQANGISVRRPPRMDASPAGLVTVAGVRSAPLAAILRRMNTDSRNFWAEVLGKYLGAQTYGAGTIANGAKAIAAFAAAHGLSFTCYDGSGLSYANRATALGILQLLWTADQEPWGAVLRSTLPSGGQGTLEDRLSTVRIRAKTGTLDDASALSGWVWAKRPQQWIEFSILSSGFSEQAAKTIENQIIKVVAANANDPNPA
jgi:D-alanyl-D-alanine carboxypeptidase/D-alanyl-D-alanine-endopeptidase (penicillin-binding protein 4)